MHFYFTVILQGSILLNVISICKGRHNSYSVTDETEEEADDNSSEDEIPVEEDYTKYFGGSVFSSNPSLNIEEDLKFVQPISFPSFFPYNGNNPTFSINNVNTDELQKYSQPSIGLQPFEEINEHSKDYLNQLGFIHPNPNVEFQKLYDKAGDNSDPISYHNTGIRYNINSYVPKYQQLRDNKNKKSIYNSNYKVGSKNRDGESKFTFTGKNDVKNTRQVLSSNKNIKNYSKPSRHEKGEGYYSREYQNDEFPSKEISEEKNENYFGNIKKNNKYTKRNLIPTKAHQEKSIYSLNTEYNPGFSFQNNHEREISRNSQKVFDKNKSIKKPIPKQRNNSKSMLSQGGDSSLSDLSLESLRKQKEVSDNDKVFLITPPKKMEKRTPFNMVNDYPTSHVNLKKDIPVLIYLNRNTSKYLPVNQKMYPSSESTIILPINDNYDSPLSLFTSSTSPDTIHYLAKDNIRVASISPDQESSKKLSKKYKYQFMNPLTEEYNGKLEKVKMESFPSTKNKRSLSHQHFEKGALQFYTVIRKNKKSNVQPNKCKKYRHTLTEEKYQGGPYGFHPKPNEELIKDKKQNDFKSDDNVRRKRNLFLRDFIFPSNMGIGQNISLIRKIRQYSDNDDYSEADTYPGYEYYRFEPEYFSDSAENEKSLEPTSYKPETDMDKHCKKIKKGNSVCVVCRNLSGDTYEQCSYASDPNKNSYSYRTSSSYNHDSSSKKKSPHLESNRYKRLTNKFGDRITYDHTDYIRNRRKDRPIELKGVYLMQNNIKKHESPNMYKTSTGKTPLNYYRKKEKYDPFYVNSSEETLISKEELQNDDDEDNSEEDTLSSEETKSYERHISRFFPEFYLPHKTRNRAAIQNSEENVDELKHFDGLKDESQLYRKTSKPKSNSLDYIPENFDSEYESKDIENILGDFSQKDRSLCKKVHKDKMLCYECVDEEGVERDDCIYFSATNPTNRGAKDQEIKQQGLPRGRKLSEIGKTYDVLNKKPIIFNQNGKNNKLKNIPEIINITTDKNNFHNTYSNDDNDNFGFSGSLNSKITYLNLDSSSEGTETFDIKKLNPKKLNHEQPLSLNIRQQRYSFKPYSVNLSENVSGKHKRNSKDKTDGMKTAGSRRNYKSTIIPPIASNEAFENGSSNNMQSFNRTNDTEETSNQEEYKPLPLDLPFEIPYGPKGAFSDETEHIYNSELKLSLPKYMAEKSEHELMFDEMFDSI